MKFNDAVIGAVLVVFSIALMLHVSIGWDWLVHNGFTGFPRAEPGRPGPALFPFTLGILFSICAIILIVRGLRSDFPWAQAQQWMRERRSVINWLAIVVGVLFYQYLSDPVGFLPVAIVLMFVLMKLLRVRTTTALLTSVACAFGIHFLFAKMLLVPLPWGLLEPIAW